MHDQDLVLTLLRKFLLTKKKKKILKNFFKSEYRIKLEPQFPAIYKGLLLL